MKLVVINNSQVQMILVTLKRLLVQRSRSASDDRQNLVNAVASGSVKEFQPTLT